MASDAEPAKILLPYLQRADELQKHEPLVAYYCRLYAMERGLKIPATERTKTTKDLLISLMGQLEKDKKSLQLGPEDNLHVEGFALSVFAKADKQDRAGRADLNTAKTFYAARIFFEILKQFGELQPDIEQMQKYAIWKASDIRKALREGRKPQPGPPGGDDDLIAASEAPQDKGVTEKARFKAPDVQPAAEQFTNISRMPGSGASVSSSAPTEHQHNYSDSDVSSYKPIHHSEISTSGYPSSYSESCSTQMPDVYAVSRLPGSYQYGSVTASDGSDGQPFHYAYTAPPHNGQVGSHSMLSPYSVPPVMGDVPLDASYYQNVYYPGSAPFSVDTTSTSQYSLHPPDERAVGYNESTPLEQTARAPASDVSAGIPVQTINNSNYQPPPEKIAEAHKASRFAVSALAFDDVPTAISYLKRSLELLTDPSASAH